MIDTRRNNSECIHFLLLHNKLTHTWQLRTCIYCLPVPVDQESQLSSSRSPAELGTPQKKNTIPSSSSCWKSSYPCSCMDWGYLLFTGYHVEATFRPTGHPKSLKSTTAPWHSFLLLQHSYWLDQTHQENLSPHSVSSKMEPCITQRNHGSFISSPSPCDSCHDSGVWTPRRGIVGMARKSTGHKEVIQILFL